MGYDYSTYKTLVERFLKEVIEKFGKDIYACALFGSVARGEAKESSDIDLFLLTSVDLERFRDKFIKLLVKLDNCKERQQLLKKGIYSYLSFILKTEEEIINDPFILLDILDHGLILYDPYGKLSNLLKKLRAKLKELGTRRIMLEDGSWLWDLKPDWKPGEIVEIKL